MTTVIYKGEAFRHEQTLTVDDMPSSSRYYLSAMNQGR